eukprot:4839260-Amphidinium_carterae.1
MAQGRALNPFAAAQCVLKSATSDMSGLVVSFLSKLQTKTSSQSKGKQQDKAHTHNCQCNYTFVPL